MNRYSPTTFLKIDSDQGVLRVEISHAEPYVSESSGFEIIRWTVRLRCDEIVADFLIVNFVVLWLRFGRLLDDVAGKIHALIPFSDFLLGIKNENVPTDFNS
jgi:hypothetical protein